MANNDEYTDEYNDEYLCRDFFVGFNFWSRLSFQISEFRVHWTEVLTPVIYGVHWPLHYGITPVTYRARIKITVTRTH